MKLSTLYNNIYIPVLIEFETSLKLIAHWCFFAGLKACFLDYVESCKHTCYVIINTRCNICDRLSLVMLRGIVMVASSRSLAMGICHWTNIIIQSIRPHVPSILSFWGH